MGGELHGGFRRKIPALGIALGVLIASAAVCVRIRTWRLLVNLGEQEQADFQNANPALARWVTALERDNAWLLFSALSASGICVLLALVQRSMRAAPWEALPNAPQANWETRLAMADALPQPTWLADAAGRILWLNRAWFEQSGGSPEGAVPQDWLSQVDERDLAAASALWLSCQAKGQPFELSVRLRVSNGGTRYFLVRVAPLKNGDAVVHQWIGTAADVDDLKRAEEALRLGEERYWMLGQATDDSLWDWDIQTDVLWWGESFYKNFGYVREEVQPNIDSWVLKLHPDDAQRVLDSIHECIASGEMRWRSEYRFARKDGTYADVLDRGHVQRDKEGKALRMIGAMMDITERKQAEEQVHILNRELEARVQKRTEEIQSANQALEAFSYSVSHDLRAPLRHITGFVQLLLRSNGARLDEQGQRYVNIILDASRKMAELIDALLTFSRLGRGVIHLARVDMNALVQDVRQSIEPEIRERSVEWRIASLPDVEADPILLRQVWVNLIDNAVKYTRCCTVAQIEIGFESAENEWIFFVGDNGVGFDMKYADKLFCVFQRLHSEKEFEGTGIGLANVQRIVTRHGGRVWANAEEGKGARFFFSIPKNPAPLREAQLAAAMLPHSLKRQS